MEQGTGSAHSLTGWLLVLGGLLMLGGIILWTGRNLWAWPAAGRPHFLTWERGLVAAGMVGTLLGFVLLEEFLHAAGDPVWSRLGLAAYALAVALGVTAEAYDMATGGYLYPLIVAFVVLALLGQAAIGFSLLQTGLLAAWVGWATVAWNLGALVLLPLLSPGDIYYPAIHLIAPLLIGVMLLI